MTRAAAMADMDRAAANRALALQHCADCGALQYPPRELCRVCLSPALGWTVTDAAEGTVLAITTVAHSHDPAMRAHLPVRIGLVELAAGPTALCFVPAAEPGATVLITASSDDRGRAVLTATPA